MDKSRVALGRWGEKKVALVYQDQGYEVIEQNFRMKGGELDLVLVRGDEIVFCEVKTRSSNRFGAGVESVNHRKQVILRRTASAWLNKRGYRGRLRFDVASVVGGQATIIANAF